MDLGFTQHFTPPELVRELVDFGVGVHSGRSLRILDPSCGDGRLLAAAKARLPGLFSTFIGVELDTVHAAAARAAVPGAHIIEGDFFDVNLEDLPGGEAVDCVLMNPPFAGVPTANRIWGRDYVRNLYSRYPEAKDRVDIAAIFLRHACNLTARGGTVSCIATKTISEGATRRAGLQPLLAQRWEIYRVIRRAPWPGRAAVNISVVHMHNGPLPDDWSRELL